MKTYRIDVTFFVDAENEEDARVTLIENAPSLMDAAYFEVEEDITE